MRAVGVILLLTLSVVPQVSGGQIVVDTNIPTNNYAYPFGNPFVTTIGQAFIAPRYATDLTLDSFGFYLQGPSTETMKGYLYAWDAGIASYIPGKAVGPALYTSPVQALTGSGGFDLIEFNIGGVALTPGATYVFIASTAEVPTSQGVSTMKINLGRDPLSYGVFFEQNRSDFSQIYTSSWMNAGESTAYRAVFSGTRLAIVPEPAAALLMAIGVGIMVNVGIVRRRRRRHWPVVPHLGGTVPGKDDPVVPAWRRMD